MSILGVMLCHLRWHITQNVRLSDSFWNFHWSKRIFQNCVSDIIIVIKGRLMLLDNLKFLKMKMKLT